MASSQKKVILRRFAGDVVCGYLPASGIVAQGEVSLLNLQGRIRPVPLSEIKTICYVRDFNLADMVNPERLERRSFLARPRGDGLWLRLTFKSTGDLLEGLTASDTSFMEAITADAGLYLLPPDARTNTQRIYVPSIAIAELQMLAVITSPSKRVPSRTQTEGAESGTSQQETLFEGAPAPATKRGRYGRH